MADLSGKPGDLRNGESPVSVTALAMAGVEFSGASDMRRLTGDPICQNRRAKSESHDAQKRKARPQDHTSPMIAALEQ